MSGSKNDSTLRIRVDNREILNHEKDLREAKKKLREEIKELEFGTKDWLKTYNKLEQVSNRLEEVRKKNNDASNAYRHQTKGVQDAQDKELLALKERLLDGELTEKEYYQKAEQMQLQHLQDKKAALEKHGRSTVAIENQIADMRLAALRKSTGEAERAWKHQQKEMDLAQRKQVMALKDSLLKQEISADKFHQEMERKELKHLEEQLELQKKHGRDTLALEEKIQDKRLSILMASEQKEKNSLEGLVESRVNATSVYGHSIGELREQYKMLTASINGTTKSAKLLQMVMIGLGIGAIVALISGIVSATKAWYNYNKEVARTARLTKALTDLSGEALKALRSDIQATADSFGVEFEDVLHATNALAEQMGISFGEALREIDRGLARSTKKDEFLEQIREYPGVFKKAGGSAREFQNIIIEGERSGIWQDKLVDAIKEADIKLSDMAKSTRDALAGAFGDEFARNMASRLESGSITTLEALREISTQAEKTGLNVKQSAAITADVFGAQAEDAAGYAKVMQTINKAYDTSRQKLNELEQTQMTQLKANKELERAWAALFDSSDGFFKETTASIKLFTTKTMISAVKAVIGFANGFIQVYNEAMLLRGSLQVFFVSVKTGLQLLLLPLKILWSNLKMIGNFLVGMWTLDFKKMGKSISDGFKEYTGIIKEEAVQLAKNFSDAFNETARGKIDPIKLKLDDSEVNKKPESTDTTAPAGPSADTELERLELSSKQRMLILKKELEQKQLTREKYDQKAKQHELAVLEDKLAIHRKHNLDTLDIEQELIDKRLEIRQAAEERQAEETAKDNKADEEKQKEHFEQLNRNHEKSLLDLKNQLIDGQITEDEYNALTEEKELAHLQKMIEERKLYKMETLDLEQQLADLRLAIAEGSREKQLENAEREHEEKLLALKEELADKQLTQEEYNRQKEQMELDHLIRLKDIREQLGLDTLDLEQKIAEQRLKILNNTANKEKSITETIKKLAEQKVQSFAQESAAALENSKNLKEAGKGILNSLRKQVKGLISSAIAKVIASALGKGLAGLVLAPIAAGAASALFNKLVPSFHTGGPTGRGDRGLGRNAGGYIQGVVEEDEYVLNKKQLRDPYIVNMVEYAEGVRKYGTAPHPAAEQRSMQVRSSVDTTAMDEMLDRRMGQFLEGLEGIMSKPRHVQISRRTGRQIVEDANEDLAYRQEARNRGTSSL